jgi:ABC-type transport system involved in multi-copper enzyme maturation permease subunit|uniref:Uncharacterized protein n=1 Tax=Mesoaciditoga lauensis TaxID=1495039 RepID=A0A7V3RFE2_9BACT
MTYTELKMNMVKGLILLVIMVGLALVPILTHSLVTGIFGSPEVQQNLKNNPIGQQGLNAILSNYSFYSYAEWFAGNYNILSMIIAIVLSFSLFSREKEHKTFYMMTGRMTRWEIFSSKVFSGYIWTAVIVVSGGLFYYILSRIMGYDLSWTMTSIWIARTAAGALLFYQIGAYISLLFSSQSKPILVDIAIFAGLITAGSFKQTKFLDFMQYMGGEDVLTKQSLGVLTFVLLLVISAGIFTLEYLQFRYSDL